MNINTLFLCLLSGVFFGSWPLIMRTTNFHYVIGAFLLQIGSIAVFLPLFKNHFDIRSFLAPAIFIGLMAGVMNGFGQLAYQKLITMKEVEISRFAIIVVITQIILTFIAGRIFFGEALTAKKILALIMSVIVVKLLMEK